MKKLVVLGLLLAASTGCGRGWFPHLFRGAPCNGLCSTAAPSLHNDCEGCNSAGYAGYEDGSVVGGAVEVGGYDPGMISSGQIIGQGAPMSTIPGPSSINPAITAPAR